MSKTSEEIKYLYDTIEQIKLQLDILERRLKNVLPLSQQQHESLRIKLKELTASSQINIEWLSRNSSMVPLDQEVITKANEVVAKRDNDWMIPTMFIVSFRQNPRLPIGSTSKTINGVWFTVVGNHPMTGMPIVSCNGSMTSGSIGSNLKEALLHGFDGIVVTDPFDVRQWNSLDGTWKHPHLEENV